jgi:hypothetical protein
MIGWISLEMWLHIVRHKIVIFKPLVIMPRIKQNSSWEMWFLHAKMSVPEQWHAMSQETTRI